MRRTNHQELQSNQVRMGSQIDGLERSVGKIDGSISNLEQLLVRAVNQHSGNP